jgi:LmbE family N-acetylglucosaminyl deacetylase
MDLKIKLRAKCLAIVAHPDDETIWMGGLILQNKIADWTIFSLCRASDADRAPKYKKVCKFYGAGCIMTDLDDEGKSTIKQGASAAEKIINKKIGKESFDYVFTHGANGEYGHPAHKSVHQAVKKLFERGKLQAKNLLFFNYEKKAKKEFSKLKEGKGSDYILKLPKKIFQEKKKIMTEIYGFAPDGIDAGYCADVEGYKRLKSKGKS